MPKFSIIVPAFNEEANIPLLFNEIKKRKIKNSWDCELIIVNDNSNDNTPELAESYSQRFNWVRVLHRKKGDNGMGAALKAGTRIAQSNRIVWVMADLSDDLNAINDFIKKLDSGADIVFGSRYMPGGSKGNLAESKAFASSFYTKTASLLFGFKVHDITNAFRAFKKKLFDSITLESNDFAISPEMAIKAAIKGFKMEEVPVTYKDREKGKSKFKFFKMGLKYGLLFKYKFFH